MSTERLTPYESRHGRGGDHVLAAELKFRADAGVPATLRASVLTFGEILVTSAAKLRGIRHQKYGPAGEQSAGRPRGPGNSGVPRSFVVGGPCR